MPQPSSSNKSLVTVYGIAAFTAISLFLALSCVEASAAPGIIRNGSIPVLGANFRVQTLSTGAHTVARLSTGEFLAIADTTDFSVERKRRFVFGDRFVRVLKVDRRGNESRIFRRTQIGRGVRIGRRGEFWKFRGPILASGLRAYVFGVSDGTPTLGGVPTAVGNAIVAFNTRTGRLDRRFGRRGVVLWRSDAPRGHYRSITRLLPLPDGSVVECGGYYRFPGVGSTFGYLNAYVRRLTSRGIPDRRFAASGFARIPSRTDLGTDFAARTCTAIATDGVGRLLVAGWGGVENRREQRVETWVRRYQADGSLDQGFGNAGELSVIGDRVANAGDPEPMLRPMAIRVLADGRIAIAGAIGDTLGFQSWRLSDSGSFDPRFGSAGVVETRDVMPYDARIGSDGAVVFVGATRSRSGVGAVGRFDAVGVPDPTFGPNGVWVSDLGFGSAFAMAFEKDDLLFLWGWRKARRGAISARDHRVWAFKPN